MVPAPSTATLTFFCKEYDWLSRRRYLRIAILEDDPTSWRSSSVGWRRTDTTFTAGFPGARQCGRPDAKASTLPMLDWQVPDISGTEVLGWLRSNVSKTCRFSSSPYATPSEDIVFAL